MNKYPPAEPGVYPGEIILSSTCTGPLIIGITAKTTLYIAKKYDYFRVKVE
jgi:hypothetical protein